MIQPGDNPLYDDLHQWWTDLANTEADEVIPKAIEYGSNSMTELGHEIAKLSGRKITDAEAIELACYFYIKGKLGRWSDAIVAGTAVSDDTIKDIGVYVRMVQRVRTHGSWPGEPIKAFNPHWSYLEGERSNNKVHNHGPHEGKGLACNESYVGGQLLGQCMLTVPKPLDLRCSECGNYPDTPGHELGCPIGRGEKHDDN